MKDVVSLLLLCFLAMVPAACAPARSDMNRSDDPRLDGGAALSPDSASPVISFRDADDYSGLSTIEPDAGQQGSPDDAASEERDAAVDAATDEPEAGTNPDAAAVVDPAPYCGDGARDPGELCDTAITSGLAGSCPTDTSCSTYQRCYTATVVNAGTCNATCQVSPLAECIDGDGCCPESCTLDDDTDCRPFGIGANLIESVTAYGKIWEYDVLDNYQVLPGSGAWLDQVPSFVGDGRPCDGFGGLPCPVSARTAEWLRLSNTDALYQMLVVGPSFWNMQITDSEPFPIVATGRLSVVQRYVQSTPFEGPCYNRGTSCYFDAAEYAWSPGGDGKEHLWEEIIAYGKIYTYDVTDLNHVVPGISAKLTDIPRFKSGPCAGVTGTCSFQTFAARREPGTPPKLIEIVTAYGKLWQFDISNWYSTGVIRTDVAARPLTDIARFTEPGGPCASAKEKGTSCALGSMAYIDRRLGVP